MGNGKSNRIKLKDIAITKDRYGAITIEADYEGYVLHDTGYKLPTDKHGARDHIEKIYASQFSFGRANA